VTQVSCWHFFFNSRLSSINTGSCESSLFFLRHYYENCFLTKAFHEATRWRHATFYCIFKNKRFWSIEKMALTVVKIITSREHRTSMLVALIDLWLSWELHLSQRLPFRLRTNALVAACQFWVTDSSGIIPLPSKNGILYLLFELRNLQLMAFDSWIQQYCRMSPLTFARLI